MYNKIKQKPKKYSLNCESRAVLPQIIDRSNRAIRERNMKNIDAMKQTLKEFNIQIEYLFFYFITKNNAN